jgi:hypothetical protein
MYLGFIVFFSNIGSFLPGNCSATVSTCAGMA